jgi:adenylate cyclase
MSYRRDLFLGVVDSRVETIAAMTSAARRAVEFDYGASLAHHDLAAAYHLAERLDNALKEFGIAHDLNPSDWSTNVGLGHALAMSGRPDDGIHQIKADLKLNPRDPRNYIYVGFLARAHFAAGRYDEVQHLARDAVRRQPASPEGYLNLAAALGQLDWIEEAREALKECERLRPGFALPANWTYSSAIVCDGVQFLEGLRKADL